MIITPDFRLGDRERIVAWAVRNQLQLYLVPNAYEVLIGSRRPTRFGYMPLLDILVLRVELRAINWVIDLLGVYRPLLRFHPGFAGHSAVDLAGRPRSSFLSAAASRP